MARKEKEIENFPKCDSTNIQSSDYSSMRAAAQQRHNLIYHEEFSEFESVYFFN
jgi:hypothetical protein